MVAKEIFDKVVALIALIILSPLFLIVAILIKIDSKGPVFFLQERVGKNGKIFKTIKFRTMTTEAPEKTKGIYIDKENPYVTRMGKFLRRSGIDELPQVINVLKGDMSFVGPRPTLEYQVKKYNDFQRRRLLMKPGITGWALINGRNKLTWDERIKLDVWYIEHWSFWLDIKILFKTVWVVARGEGLTAPDRVKKIDEKIFNEKGG
jgi:undecaprenyl phosphate N,N'-diacetylbacillosamine 1-phosphate transferase